MLETFNTESLLAAETLVFLSYHVELDGLQMSILTENGFWTEVSAKSILLFVIKQENIRFFRGVQCA